MVRLRSLLAHSGFSGSEDVVGAVMVGLCITSINLGMRYTCEWAVDEIERPSALSHKQGRLMTFVSFAYIVNVTIIPFIAHTPVSATFDPLTKLRDTTCDDELALRHATYAGRVMAIFGENYVNYLDCIDGFEGLFSRCVRVG